MLASLHKYKLLLSIAAVLILIMTAVGGFSSAQSASILVEPETANTVAGIRGHIRFAGGADGQGQKFVTSGEYCSRSEGCRSEAIVVQAWTDTQTVWNRALCSYRYKVSITDAGGVYREQPQLSSAWFHPEYRGQSQTDYYLADDFSRNPIYVTGPYEGAIKIELQANITKTWYQSVGFQFGGNTCKTEILASDGAQLLRGDGGIVLKQGQSNLFEEGKVVTFVATTQQGYWKASVFDANGRPVCGVKSGGFLNSLSILSARYFDPGQTDRMTHAENSATYNVDNVAIPPQFLPAKPKPTSSTEGCKDTVTWSGPRNGGELRFEIPHGSFNAAGVGNNRWTIRLENTLTTHSQEAFFVIDQKAKAPEPPVVEKRVTETSGAPVNHAIPTKKLVTFEMTSRANGLTGAAITDFVLYAWYGNDPALPPGPTSPNWILNGISVPATKASDGSYTATYQVEVEPLDVQARFHSVDAQGRNSGTKLNEEDKKVLEEEGKIENPNGDSEIEVDVDGKTDAPAGPASPAKDSHAGAILVVLALVLGLLAFLHVPGTPGMKAAAAFFAMSIIGVYAWMSGTIGGVV